MEKNENYSFPSEVELKEIRGKTSNPNYPYRNKILPANASAEEKSKYQICQAILVYQQENNLTENKLAQRIGISKDKSIDILCSKTYNLELNELTCFTEKLGIKNIDLGDIPFSQIPTYLGSRFLHNKQERI